MDGSQEHGRVAAALKVLKERFAQCAAQGHVMDLISHEAIQVSGLPPAQYLSLAWVHIQEGEPDLEWRLQYLLDHVGPSAFSYNGGGK